MNLKPQFAKWRVSKWREFLANIHNVPIGISDTDTAMLVLCGKLFIEEFVKEKGTAMAKLVPPPEVQEILDNPDKDIPIVSESYRQQQSGQLRVFDEHYNTSTEHLPPAPKVSEEDHLAVLNAAIAPPQPLSNPDIVPTKTEQVRELQNEQAIANGGQLPNPAEAQKRLETLEKIRESADDPMKQKWAIAEAIARSQHPPLSMEEQDSEIKEMVRYCEFWIKETQEVPEYPIPVVNIYWEKKAYDNAPETIDRRAEVMGAVVKYWAQIVEKNGEKMNLEFNGLSDFDTSVNKNGLFNEFDRCLRIGSDKCSYRIVMAAMNLQKAVENYATNHRMNGQPNQISDSELRDAVKTKVVEYYQAHLALENVGPTSTLDPNYVEFRHLCKKYNLDKTKFLHLQQM